MWISTLLFVCLLFEVVSAQLNANGNTTGVYGGEAYYHCSLADTAGVLQVTWQRMYKDESVENLATYSKRFGSQINEPHQNKVEFTKASLSSTSITVKNLTWDDEACYICTFNAYPSGSRRKQTCLTVQGISNMKTDVQQSSSDDRGQSQVVFTCSATGRTAPTIQWNSTGGQSVITVQNDDNTFTTTSNLTLLSPYSAGHIYCLVNNVMRHRIAMPALNGDRKTEDDSVGERSHLVIVVIVGIILVVAVLSAAVLIRRKAGCRNAPLPSTTEELDVFEEGV